MFYGSQLDLFSIIPTLSLLPSKSGYFWLQNKQKKKRWGWAWLYCQTNQRATSQWVCTGSLWRAWSNNTFCHHVQVLFCPCPLVGWLFGLFVSRIVRETWMVDVGPKPAEPETGEAVRGCFKMLCDSGLLTTEVKGTVGPWQRYALYSVPF